MLLSQELFATLTEAQVLVEDWRTDYNHRRPHSALGMMAPARFAASWRRSEEQIKRLSLGVDRRGVRSLVHDVASDAHGVECRPPGLLVGFERLDGELPGLIDQAEWFTRAAPGAILAGEELPPRLPAPARRRRGLGRVMAALRRRRG